MSDYSRKSQEDLENKYNNGSDLARSEAEHELRSRGLVKNDVGEWEDNSSDIFGNSSLFGYGLVFVILNGLVLYFFPNVFWGIWGGIWDLIKMIFGD